MNSFLFLCIFGLTSYFTYNAISFMMSSIFSINRKFPLCRLDLLLVLAVISSLFLFNLLSLLVLPLIIVLQLNHSLKEIRFSYLILLSFFIIYSIYSFVFIPVSILILIDLVNLKLNHKWFKYLYEIAPDILRGSIDEELVFRYLYKKEPSDKLLIFKFEKTMPDLKSAIKYFYMIESVSYREKYSLLLEHHKFYISLLELKTSDLIIKDVDFERNNQSDQSYRKNNSMLVLAHFNNKCANCDSTVSIEMDHFIIPKSKGGNFKLILRDGSSFNNMIPLCKTCNLQKTNMLAKDFFSVNKYKYLIFKNLEITLKVK